MLTEFSSEVIHGYQMGRKLGFPTANLYGDIDDGTFAGYAVLNGVKYCAIIFAGVAKTLNREKKTVEVHILHDFKDEEFYGAQLKVQVIEKLRDNQKFEGLDELKRELEQDCDDARRILLGDK